MPDGRKGTRTAPVSRILVQAGLPGDATGEAAFLRRVREVDPEAACRVGRFADLAADDLSGFDIVFGALPPGRLEEAAALRWLHLPSAGFDGYADRSRHLSPDLVVTGSSGVFGIPIAEHVLGVMIALSRNLSRYALQQRDREWKPILDGRRIAGSTVGLLGFGDIGREVARRVRALGARVLAARRTPEAVAGTDGTGGLATDAGALADEVLSGDAGIDRVVEQADFLVLSLPDTPRTRGLLSEARLRRMKPGSVVINVGRGTAVDQDALVRVLREGRIGGAALDVMVPEPLPADHPLWGLTNVLLTPHVSGHTMQNREPMLAIFLDNLQRFRAGEPLRNRLDPDEGY